MYTSSHTVCLTRYECKPQVSALVQLSAMTLDHCADALSAAVVEDRARDSPDRLMKTQSPLRESWQDRRTKEQPALNWRLKVVVQ